MAVFGESAYFSPVCFSLKGDLLVSRVSIFILLQGFFLATVSQETRIVILSRICVLQHLPDALRLQALFIGYSVDVAAAAAARDDVSSDSSTDSDEEEEEDDDEMEARFRRRRQVTIYIYHL